MTPEFRAWYTPFKDSNFGRTMKYGRAGTILNFAEMSPDKYVVEQYTGLKDKKDNEIFEGDIVRVCYVGDFDGENPHNQFVTSVEFNAPMFDLNRHHIPQEWALYSSLSALLDVFELEDGDYEIEVIGNIHENQELLEEQ